MHYELGGVPVQMFPTTTNPVFRDTVDKARLARVGGLHVKVASPEHLILFEMVDRLLEMAKGLPGLESDDVARRGEGRHGPKLVK